MMKRYLSMILVLAAALALATVPAGASSGSAWDVDVNDIPERAQLEEFLAAVEPYIQVNVADWDWAAGHNYNCQMITTMDNDSIFNALIYRHEFEPEGQDIYPGERQQIIRNTGTVYSDSYSYRSDKSRVDWIMENVFNCGREDLETLKARAFQSMGQEGQPAILEADGYYYGQAPDSFFGENRWHHVEVVSAKHDGFYYYISFNGSYPVGFHAELNGQEVFVDGEASQLYYATLALKEINGKAYWSLYAINSTDFVDFDTTIAEPVPAASFSDVEDSAWYAGDVKDIQKYGLINGYPDGSFRPLEKLTLAQAITLAARTHAWLNGGNNLENGNPWYQPYVDYAAENGLCFPGELGTDYGGECSRLNMAVLFQRAFPVATEDNRNTITSLPDIEDIGYGSAVFYLYRQGVLTGNDSAGTFKPDQGISRAEASAILNRIMDTEKRKTFTLAAQPPLAAFRMPGV